MLRLIPVISVALGLAGNAAGQDSHGFGLVTPVELPDIAATRHDGVTVRLRDQFAGRRSAVQFVFTECTTACPLLGSLFQRVDKASAGQLVSISVDPERDTPPRMAKWLAKFRASQKWIGLRVDPSSLPALLQAFKQESGPPSGHTLQVFLVDENARYIARTTEMPSASAVATALRLPASGREPETALIGTGLTAGRDLFEGRGGIVGTIGPDRLDPHASRCASCHGSSGNGGSEGKTIVPPLTNPFLTARQPRRGGPPSSYSEQSFCESLRTGRDPAGVEFSALMPRYRIDGRSCSQLWRFLTSAR